MKQVVLRITNELKSADLEPANRENKTQESDYVVEDPNTIGTRDIASLAVQEKYQNKDTESHTETQQDDDNEEASINVEFTHNPTLPVRPARVEKKKEKEEKEEDEEEETGISKMCRPWLQSKMYNTAFTPHKRHYLFIPSQLLLIIMLVISTAVSNVAGGILCGIIGEGLAAVLSGWIIWTYRSEATNKFYVFGFYFGEALTILFGIIGGFSLNQKFIFYLGFPGIIVCVAVTVVAYITIVLPWRRAQKPDVSEIV